MDTAVLSTPGDLLEGLKLGLFQDRVFVFTPEGDVEDLPAGSTPLDFAYSVGTEIGHRCFAARVNNRLVRLDCRLKNGDIVEIVTTNVPAGPSRDWLSIVRSPHAREEIQRWLGQHA
jgi:guanosine-3',5'-bis(diphosphate) 3'-pyrophosphohydrolase